MYRDSVSDHFFFASLVFSIYLFKRVIIIQQKKSFRSDLDQFIKPNLVLEKLLVSPLFIMLDPCYSPTLLMCPLAVGFSIVTVKVYKYFIIIMVLVRFIGARNKPLLREWNSDCQRFLLPLFTKRNLNYQQGNKLYLNK